jgi:hypothetical protein
VRGVRVDRHVERHPGEVQQRTHRVAAQKEADEVPDRLVREPPLEPQDQIEEKEQPRLEALEGVDAVACHLGGLPLEPERQEGRRAGRLGLGREEARGHGDLVHPDDVQKREEPELDRGEKDGPAEFAPREAHRAPSQGSVTTTEGKRWGAQ